MGKAFRCEATLRIGTIDPMSSLELTLMYLLAAVLGVVGCRMLKLPPILGYLNDGSIPPTDTFCPA